MSIPDSYGKQNPATRFFPVGKGLAQDASRASCAPGKGGELDEVVYIAGSVNNAMNLDSLAADDVKDEIILDDEDPIPVFTKFRMSGYSSQKRMMFELRDTFIQSVDKRDRAAGAVSCDELQNGNEIILGNRKVPKGGFTGHSCVDEVLSSFVGGLFLFCLLPIGLARHRVFQRGPPGL